MLQRIGSFSRLSYTLTYYLLLVTYYLLPANLPPLVDGLQLSQFYRETELAIQGICNKE